LNNRLFLNTAARPGKIEITKITTTCAEKERKNNRRIVLPINFSKNKYL